MGLACLFSTPNSSPPFLSAQNAFVIFPSVLIQIGGKGQEREKRKLQKEWEQEAFGKNLVKETEILGNLHRKWQVLLFEADSKIEIQIKHRFSFFFFFKQYYTLPFINLPIRVKNNIYLYCVAFLAILLLKLL